MNEFVNGGIILVILTIVIPIVFFLVVLKLTLGMNTRTRVSWAIAVMIPALLLVTILLYNIPIQAFKEKISVNKLKIESNKDITTISYKNYKQEFFSSQRWLTNASKEMIDALLKDSTLTFCYVEGYTIFKTSAGANLYLDKSP